MNVVDLFVEHGVDYKLPGDHHHVNHNWVGVDCPYCSPGWKSYRMGWSNAKRYFNCWQCGPQRTGETLALLLNVGPDEAVRIAKELRVNDELNPILVATKARGTLRLPEPRGPMTYYHRRFLEQRGFNVEEVTRLWELEGITMHTRLPWRIFIPIHDKDGEVVSWTTRSVQKNPSVRYVNARASEEKVSAKHLLYGEWRVPGHAIIVCEGPTDVWAIGPGAVAVTGLQASMQQIWRMAQYPVRVVCLDSEPLAQERANKLCEQLAPFEGETYRVKLETAKDPSDCLLSDEGLSELEWMREKFLWTPTDEFGPRRLR